MLTKPLQPLLRFNMMNSKIMNSTSGDVKFQPFLRFNLPLTVRVVGTPPRPCFNPS